MSSIRVMFMKEEAIETLLSNSKKVTEFMKTNNRPKKVLNYKTPADLFGQELQKCCT